MNKNRKEFKEICKFLLSGADKNEETFEMNCISFDEKTINTLNNIKNKSKIYKCHYLLAGMDLFIEDEEYEICKMIKEKLDSEEYAQTVKEISLIKTIAKLF